MKLTRQCYRWQILHMASFLRTAMGQKHEVMRKRISGTTCQTCPSHKSQTVFNTCVWRRFWAPVTHTLWQGCKHLQTHENAYQTRAAAQATPREPCPNCSWRWPRLWDLSRTCWAGLCPSLYSPNHRRLQEKQTDDSQSIEKGVCFKGNPCSRNVRLHLA